MHVSSNVLLYLETNKYFLEIAECQLHKMQHLPLFDSCYRRQKRKFFYPQLRAATMAH